MKQKLHSQVNSEHVFFAQGCFAIRADHRA